MQKIIKNNTHFLLNFTSFNVDDVFFRNISSNNNHNYDVGNNTRHGIVKDTNVNVAQSAKQPCKELYNFCFWNIGFFLIENVFDKYPE